MAPPLLQLDDIRLTFGGTPLLEGAGFTLSRGERIALVGRNGSGKSTLLKIAGGITEPQEGTIFRQPGATIRYLEQAPDLSAYKTIGDCVTEGLDHHTGLHQALNMIEMLGLSPERAPLNLSGGEARRVALVRAIASEPDILMLDEPTNHLDLPTIEWLEGALRPLASAIILISHDRRFLETVSRQVLWLDRGEIKRLDQGFGHFEDWRDTLLEAEELEQHKLARKVVREEHWIRHGVSGRRKRNVRRLAELGQLKDEIRSHRAAQGGVTFAETESGRSGKLVLEAHNASVTLGGTPILDSFGLRIQRGERIGVVGANGAGKTTLIKLLTGTIKPDTGSVKIGTSIDLAIYDQSRESLPLDQSVSAYLTEGRGDTLLVNGEMRHVTGYMKDYLFQPEQARTPIAELSGGEKARLMLARIMAKPANMLVLDEPTNDLDMETLDLLQERIATFDGTVIIVSHDRDFLDRCATTTLLVEREDDTKGGIVTRYAGGYTDMIAQRGSGVKNPLKEAQKADKPKKAKPQNKPGSNAQKLSFKQKYALENLPKEMEAIEANITALEAALAKGDRFTKDPDGFAKDAQKLEKLREDLAAKEEEWLELEMMREEIEG